MRDRLKLNFLTLVAATLAVVATTVALAMPVIATVVSRFMSLLITVTIVSRAWRVA